MKFFIIALLLLTSGTAIASDLSPKEVARIRALVTTKSKAKKPPSNKVTFDGVYFRNSSGDVIGMRTRCKPCRLGS